MTKIQIFGILWSHLQDGGNQNQIPLTNMSYKTLVKAAYFFLNLECKYMNEINNDPYLSEEEAEELTACASGWGWLEAYINWVL